MCAWIHCSSPGPHPAHLVQGRALASQQLALCPANCPYRREHQDVRAAVMSMTNVSVCTSRAPMHPHPSFLPDQSLSLLPTACKAFPEACSPNWPIVLLMHDVPSCSCSNLWLFSDLKCRCWLSCDPWGSLWADLTRDGIAACPPLRSVPSGCPQKLSGHVPKGHWGRSSPRK